METSSLGLIPGSPLESASRPLLRLAQAITGMDSTFVTSIDWEDQTQLVLYAQNEGSLELPEGLTVDWRDSMCRSLFLSGVTQTSAIGTQVSATSGSEALGLETFFAVPILIDDVVIGTVCGASQKKMVIAEHHMHCMGLIAEALQQLLEIDRAKSKAEVRAELAELDAEEMRITSHGQAIELRHMEQLAHTDVLTGLQNRRAFMARWEDELARSGRKHYPIGLILIDADLFKGVNDSAGHAVGDSVLQAIGSSLLAVANSPDFVARLGGDEFAMVTTHISGDDLERLGEDIQKVFAVKVAELGVQATLSIGLVTSDDCPRDQLLADADKALYRSKDAGGNAIRMHKCDAPRTTPEPV